MRYSVRLALDCGYAGGGGGNGDGGGDEGGSRAGGGAQPEQRTSVSQAWLTEDRAGL